MDIGKVRNGVNEENQPFLDLSEHMTKGKNWLISARSRDRRRSRVISCLTRSVSSPSTACVFKDRAGTAIASLSTRRSPWPTTPASARPSTQSTRGRASTGSNSGMYHQPILVPSSKSLIENKKIYHIMCEKCAERNFP